MSRLFSLNRLGILRRNDLVKIINLASLIFFSVYFLSMCLLPWIVGDFQWKYVQSVWDRWQGFNVGVLAFVSSVIALNIARFNAGRQRERNFQAAKAFLPHALSELCNYFRLTAEFLMAARDQDYSSGGAGTYPALPAGYKAVFRECIRYADPNVGEYLADIVSRLQVLDARLRGFSSRRNKVRVRNPNPINTIDYLVDVGELQALVNRLFEFSRNRAEFDGSALSWEEFYSAYRNLNIEIERYNLSEHTNLEAKTKRRLHKLQS